MKLRSDSADRVPHRTAACAVAALVLALAPGRASAQVAPTTEAPAPLAPPPEAPVAVAPPSAVTTVAPIVVPPPALEDEVTAAQLGRTLQYYAERDRRTLVGRGVTGIGVGVAGLGGSAALLATRDSGLVLPAVFFGAAGLGLVLGGIINLASVTPMEQLNRDYQRMRRDQSAHDAVDGMEQRWRTEVARAAGQRRFAATVGFVGVGLGIGAGALATTEYFIPGFDRGFATVLMGTAAVLTGLELVLAVGALTTESEIEVAYHAWRLGHSPTVASRLRFTAPTLVMSDGVRGLALGGTF